MHGLTCTAQHTRNNIHRQRGLTQNLGWLGERWVLILIFMHFYRVKTCMLANIHKLQKSYEFFMRVCQVSFSPYRPSNLIDSLIEPLHTRLTYTSIHLCMLVFVSCQGAIFLHMSRGFRAPSKRKLLLGWFGNAFEKDTHFKSCAHARASARKFPT